MLRFVQMCEGCSELLAKHGIPGLGYACEGTCGCGRVSCCVQ